MSAVEQLLSPKERQEIESRLSNYHIPFQILQLVAEECGCSEVILGGRETRGKGKAPSLVSRLNDRALIQLRQIFLECDDSFSAFRLAVFLSSKFTPVSYKFVMAKKVRGKSDLEHMLDVCIYSRETEDLIAIGMQNNEGKASDTKSLHKFLSMVSDISAVHPGVRSAYYSSSYGYGRDPSGLATKNQSARQDGRTEVKFLEFHDGVYRQIKEQ